VPFIDHLLQGRRIAMKVLLSIDRVKTRDPRMEARMGFYDRRGSGRGRDVA
jgi:hypothetical protein